MAKLDLHDNESLDFQFTIAFNLHTHSYYVYMHMDNWQNFSRGAMH